MDQSKPGQLCQGRCVLGQDTSPTLPHVNVYDCCMFEVVVGGAEWQPCSCQSAPGQLWLLSWYTTTSMTEWNLKSCKSALGVLKSAIQIQSIIMLAS